MIELSLLLSALMVVLFGALTAGWLYCFVQSPSDLYAWLLLLTFMPLLAAVGFVATASGAILRTEEGPPALNAAIALIARGGMIAGGITLVVAFPKVRASLRGQD